MCTEERCGLRKESVYKAVSSLEFSVRGCASMIVLSVMDRSGSSERNSGDYVQDASEQPHLCPESACRLYRCYEAGTLSSRRADKHKLCYVERGFALLFTIRLEDCNTERFCHFTFKCSAG